MSTLRNGTFAASLALLSACLFAGPLAAQVVPPPGMTPGNPYGMGANPYSTMFPGASGSSLANPYTTGTPGYIGGGYGGYPVDVFPYAGIAKIIDSQGQYWMSEEKARIIHEKAYQEFLMSKKKAKEYELWLAEVTPTFTDITAKNAATLLKRIQKYATPVEIWSGRALNILKKDLEELQVNKAKVDLEPLKLDDTVLKHLNVTRPNGGSLGLLRNEGRFTWPLALIEIVDEKLRNDVERNAQDLVSQAASGKINVNTLKDLQTRIKEIREQLTKSDAPVRQQLQAFRFLDDFQSAIYALETDNLARAYFEYQRWIVGGKTAPQIVEYMSSRGLSFAPASQGDEFAYEALYAAMANYDVEFNRQVAKQNPKQGSNEK